MVKSVWREAAMTIEGERAVFRLTVNGAEHDVDVLDGTPLLAVLRDELGLKGSRFGCGLEQCGACMVLVDGEAVPSCARSADTFAGRRITTVEGSGRPKPRTPCRRRSWPSRPASAATACPAS